MRRKATVFSITEVENGLRLGFYYNRKNCLSKFFRLYIPTSKVPSLIETLCKGEDYVELLDKNYTLEWNDEYEFCGIKREGFDWWRGKAYLTKPHVLTTKKGDK